MLEDRDALNFVKIDKEALDVAKADSHAVTKKLNTGGQLVSIDEIIHLGLNKTDELDRCIFKLQNNEARLSSGEDSLNQSITREFGEAMFFKVRVRKHTYMNKATIALIIRNTTSKVKEKLHRMRDKEEE